MASRQTTYSPDLWPFVDPQARAADWDTTLATYAHTVADLDWHRRVLTFLGWS
jgi:hypothetical protein